MKIKYQLSPTAHFLDWHRWQYCEYDTYVAIMQPGYLSVAGPRGVWGACSPLLFYFLFFIIYYSFLQKLSLRTKKVWNLSQNAWNGHFRDWYFQIFWEEHALRHPRKLAPSARWLPSTPPFYENPGSARGFLIQVGRVLSPFQRSRMNQHQT